MPDLNNDMVLKNIRTEYFRICRQHNTGEIDNDEFYTAWSNLIETTGAYYLALCENERRNNDKILS